MNGSELIAKRLTFITDCVAEIRQLGKPQQLLVDKVQQRFVEHTLQNAIHALLDVAFAIASEHNLGEPEEERQVFERLQGAGWITPAMCTTCKRMVAFRNVVVRRYLQVDPRIVQSIVERDLDDLLAFVKVVRDRLA